MAIQIGNQNNDDRKSQCESKCCKTLFSSQSDPVSRYHQRKKCNAIVFIGSFNLDPRSASINKDNKDDYTAESRRKAKVELTAAKTNRLNPAKCRKNILDARAELTKGKRDKKHKD